MISSSLLSVLDNKISVRTLSFSTSWRFPLTNYQMFLLFLKNLSSVCHFLIKKKSLKSFRHSETSCYKWIGLTRVASYKLQVTSLNIKFRVKKNLRNCKKNLRKTVRSSIIGNKTNFSEDFIRGLNFLDPPPTALVDSAIPWFFFQLV